MYKEGINSTESYLAAVERARDAAASYYNQDIIEMSDQEYDLLLASIKDYEEKHPDSIVEHGLFTKVAAGVGSGGKIKHKAPMLSLDNLYDEESARLWFRSKEETYDLTYGIFVEPKVDGLSLSASYRNGVLTNLATRGDGESGDDVTYAASRITNLPKRLKVNVDLDVRGEVFFTKSDFEQANSLRVSAGKPPFVNARNAASGMLRAETLDHAVTLTFVVHGLSSYSHSLWSDELTYLSSIGLPVNLNQCYICSNSDDLVEAITKINSVRSDLEYEIDGAVLKVNSISVREKMGHSLKSPRWGIAYKFPAYEVTSKLIDVEWTVGRTGRITPRARILPCFVGGVTIEYATLHNSTDIIKKGFMLNDTVLVKRAGDVIPKLEGVLVNMRDGTQIAISVPSNCPKCDSLLDKSELVWRCPQGRKCGVVESLSHSVSRDALNIDSLGSKVIEQLVSKGIVSDISDLYRLNLEDLLLLDRVGEKLASKILLGIEQSRSADLSRILSALGIRSTGKGISRRLAKRFKNLESFRNAGKNELSEVEGIGHERAEVILSEVTELSDVIDRLIDFGVVGESAISDERTNILDGKTVVVSGSMSGELARFSRDDMVSLIENLGGKSSTSVSAKTSILVAGEGAGSKTVKARELGIKVLTPDEFYNLINSGGNVI